MVDSSEASDAFEGQESEEESDNGSLRLSGRGKCRHISHVNPKTPTKSPIKNGATKRTPINTPTLQNKKASKKVSDPNPIPVRGGGKCASKKQAQSTRPSQLSTQRKPAASKRTSSKLPTPPPSSTASKRQCTPNEDIVNGTLNPQSVAMGITQSGPGLQFQEQYQMVSGSVSTEPSKPPSPSHMATPRVSPLEGQR